MKVVTICGSMRFQDEMIKIATDLETDLGYCVFQPVYLVDGKSFTNEEYKNIVDAHFKKIDLSDAVYVVNIGGYIGKSTSEEIEYARKHGKEVLFHEGQR